MYRKESTGEIGLMETSLMSKNTKSNDRAFFALYWDEDRNFYIEPNPLLFEIVTEKDIKFFTAFSDGIGSATEQTLSEKFADTSSLKNEIIQHAQENDEINLFC